MQETTVVGIDPSLTGLAVCRLNPEGHDVCTLTSPSAGDDWESRSARYGDFASKVAKAVQQASHPIFIEGYSFGSKQSQSHKTGEFGCYLRLKLSQVFKVGIVEVTPSELKQWITGKGNASKDVVVSALSAQTGIQFKDNNQVDAYSLALIGRYVLGFEECRNAMQRKIVGNVRERNCLKK